jgi:hypothetical protein
MPVDITAATLQDTAGLYAGTGPIPGAALGSQPQVIAQGRTVPGAVESAPTVAGGVTGRHLTPLGTAAAPPAPKKSRTGLVVGLVLIALVAAGAAFEVPKLLHDGRLGLGDNGTITQTPSGLVTSTPSTATATTNVVMPPHVASTEPTPKAAPHDPKSPKTTTSTATGRAAPAVKATAVEAPPATHETPPPVTPPAPEPPPPAIVAPPPVPAPPLPAPAFNPQTCRAQPGAVRSTGATNAKDLTMNGTGAAWTGCAQRSLHEKPGAPITGSVHLSFTDNGAFRGATCAACPAPLAQCIASSTKPTVRLKITGGDVTGEPGFEVPITVTCE